MKKKPAKAQEKQAKAFEKQALQQKARWGINTKINVMLLIWTRLAAWLSDLAGIIKGFYIFFKKDKFILM